MTAVLIEPLGILLYLRLINDKVLDNLEGYLLFAIFGMVFSVPSLLLLWLATYKFNKADLPVTISKGILSVIGVILTSVAMVLLHAVFTTEMNFFYGMSYSVVIIAGLWFYKLKPVLHIADSQ